MELCTGEPKKLKKEEKDSSRVLMPFAGRAASPSTLDRSLTRRKHTSGQRNFTWGRPNLG